MNANAQAEAPAAFHALRRLAQRRSETEQCDFCSLPLRAAHRHLLEVATRKVVCVCDACALAFVNAKGRWKIIPRDTRPLPEFQMTDMDWAALGLPVQLAFMFHSTPVNKPVAIYPSPGGPTESLLSLTNWETIVTANPCLARMEPDVEALLVNRLQPPHQYYLAPLDVCYQLSGLIRLHWRGFSGGEKVWSEVRSFFERLAADSAASDSPGREAAHA